MELIARLSSLRGVTMTSVGFLNVWTQFMLLFCVLDLRTSAYMTGFYADEAFHPGGGGQTVLLNRIPGEHRRALKREILSLLGLHHRPRPSSHGKFNSAPNYMLEMYNTLKVEEGEEGEEASEGKQGDGVPPVVKQRLVTHNLTLPGMEESAGGADMIASFINRGNSHRNAARHRLRHEQNRMLYFDFSEVPPEMSVTGAELRVYKVPTHRYGSNNKSITLEIYKIYEDHHRSYERALSLEVNVSLAAGYEGWVDLNTTSAAAQWNFFPVSNLGLYIAVKDEYGDQVEPSSVGIIDAQGPDDKQPFMVAFFKATQEVKSRRARGAGRRHQRTEVTYNDEPTRHQWGTHASGRSNTRACQRRQLYVSFRDLGWQEWIIAPDGYPAFFCNGECAFPLNVHMNATNHAIVQTLVHLMHPSKAPKPSCAPIKLSSISVLYFDDNSNVILKKYKNMVVRACGCH